MSFRSREFRKAFYIAALLGTLSAAALADQAPLLLSGPALPLCYCHCVYESGSKHCTKMCELPQYANRWWAISCHKKNTNSMESSSPDLNKGSKKTNRTEESLR